MESPLAAHRRRREVDDIAWRIAEIHEQIAEIQRLIQALPAADQTNATFLIGLQGLVARGRDELARLGLELEALAAATGGERSTGIAQAPGEPPLGVAPTPSGVTPNGAAPPSNHAAALPLPESPQPTGIGSGGGPPPPTVQAQGPLALPVPSPPEWVDPRPQPAVSPVLVAVLAAVSAVGLTLGLVAIALVGALMTGMIVPHSLAGGAPAAATTLAVPTLRPPATPIAASPDGVRATDVPSSPTVGAPLPAPVPPQLASDPTPASPEEPAATLARVAEPDPSAEEATEATVALVADGPGAAANPALTDEPLGDPGSVADEESGGDRDQVAEEAPVVARDPAVGSAIVRAGPFRGVRLREAPSTSAPIVAIVDNGTAVELLAGSRRANGYPWARIRTSDGQEGWTIATALAPT